MGMKTPCLGAHSGSLKKTLVAQTHNLGAPGSSLGIVYSQNKLYSLREGTLLREKLQYIREKNAIIPFLKNSTCKLKTNMTLPHHISKHMTVSDVRQSL